MLRLVSALLVALLFAVPVQAAKRVALVIGNGGYIHVPRLTNPQRDANTVAEALRRVGFDVVDVRSDLTKTDMEAALQMLARKAGGAEAAVLYYAGHGMEMGGENYLIPVDASLNSADDLRFEAVPLSLVQQAVKNASLLKLVILDACRNNPFAQRLPSTGRSVTRGLAPMKDTQLGGDMLVAFAASEGKVADDNSGYAKAFARAIAIPGLDTPRALGRIRDEVLETTKQQQEPVVYGSYSSKPFYFVPASVDVRPNAQPATLPPKAIEMTFWQSVADSDDIHQLQSYIDKYPKGDFVELAKAKINALRTASARRPNQPVAATVPETSNGETTVSCLLPSGDEIAATVAQCRARFGVLTAAH